MASKFRAFVVVIRDDTPIGSNAVDDLAERLLNDDEIVFIGNPWRVGESDVYDTVNLIGQRTHSVTKVRELMDTELKLDPGAAHFGFTADAARRLVNQAAAGS